MTTTAALRIRTGALLYLPCKNIQCDEIWSFCYSKQRNVPNEHRGEFGYGDVCPHEHFGVERGALARLDKTATSPHYSTDLTDPLPKGVKAC